MKSLANTTAMIAPITMPATWKRNWIVRLVPSRQPVERSCCMSQASLVDTSSTVAAIRPTIGSRSPIAAIRITVTTKAEEIGF